MSSHPIEWHEDCLKNMKLSYEEKLAYIRNRVADADRLSADIDDLSKKIERAKNSKKTSFDREKFKAA